MKFFASKMFLSLCVVVIGSVTSLAHAQATRTWVSGVGDDANPCSRTAPCKTFAGAISKTAAGGEINAIDAGGFGAVTITKSITIDGGGSMASILGSSTNGVIINVTSPTDKVVLRRLSINGAGTGLVGVKILASKTVIIEDTSIDGFTGGIGLTASTVNTHLDVRNVTITGGNVGMNVGGTNPVATLNNVTIRGATTGLVLSGGDTYMRNSNLIHNGTAISGNGGRMSSFGDNMVVGNTSNGAAANYSITRY